MCLKSTHEIEMGALFDSARDGLVDRFVSGSFGDVASYVSETSGMLRDKTIEVQVPPAYMIDAQRAAQDCASHGVCVSISTLSPRG
mgnify:CR=1 FL=1